jgi:hypothetical protein
VYTLSASGRTSDRGEFAAAQRFSQIRSPDAPAAYEKSRLGSNRFVMELVTSATEAPSGRCIHVLVTEEDSISLSAILTARLSIREANMLTFALYRLSVECSTGEL